MPYILVIGTCPDRKPIIALVETDNATHGSKRKKIKHDDQGKDFRNRWRACFGPGSTGNDVSYTHGPFF